MELELWQFAVLFAAAFFGGFIDSIAGGGGLISLPALLAVGVPPHVAIATNRFQGSFGSFTAALNFIRKGYVDAAPIQDAQCLRPVLRGGGYGYARTLIEHARVPSSDCGIIVGEKNSKIRSGPCTVRSVVVHALIRFRAGVRGIDEDGMWRRGRCRPGQAPPHHTRQRAAGTADPIFETLVSLAEGPP